MPETGTYTNEFLILIHIASETSCSKHQIWSRTTDTSTNYGLQVQVSHFHERLRSRLTLETDCCCAIRMLSNTDQVYKKRLAKSLKESKAFKGVTVKSTVGFSEHQSSTLGLFELWCASANVCRINTITPSSDTSGQKEYIRPLFKYVDYSPEQSPL